MSDTSSSTGPAAPASVFAPSSSAATTSTAAVSAPAATAAAPAPAPNRPFYVAHAMFTLPNGNAFARGDVLRTDDALAFETAVATGNTDVNNATPTDVDPSA